jgi:hypothetical protein
MKHAPHRLVVIDPADGWRVYSLRSPLSWTDCEAFAVLGV